jgi:hypothetical protein
VGDEAFLKQMEAFGKKHGGKTIDASEFESILQADEKALTAWKVCAKQSPVVESPFAVRVEQFTNEAAKKQFKVSGSFERDDVAARPRTMEVTLEFSDRETTSLVRIDETGHFSLTADAKPTRVVLNKYLRTPTQSGSTTHVNHYTSDLANCVIVYGTKDFAEAQRNAAERLKESIRRGNYNYRVPVVSDRDVDLAKLTDKHLLLVGTPKTNLVAEKLADTSPVKFGSGSFEVDGETFGNPKSAVVSAVPNPRAREFSVVLIGGLSGEATYNAVEARSHGMRGAELLLMPGGGHPRNRVLSSGWVGRAVPSN